MNTKASLNQLAIIGMILCLLVISLPADLSAQTGLTASISYDLLPYQDFDQPIKLDDGSTLDDAQARLSKQRATVSYPLVFSEGRTVLVNELTYQVIDFEYRGFDAESVPRLERLHSASYTLMLQHRASQEWSVWALATPSMASDLKASVSSDDFNFQGVLLSIRHFSDRFSLGLGAAYSTQFGSAVPLPVLAFDWNNGKNMMARAILPVSLEFWYRTSPRLDLGLMVAGDGNNFRGDPAIYGAADPQLRYTMLTVGPAAKLRLSKTFLLSLEAGLTGLHRFEFFDGDKEEVAYDFKPSQYVRLGLHYGG